MPKFNFPGQDTTDYTSHDIQDRKVQPADTEPSGPPQASPAEIQRRATAVKLALESFDGGVGATDTLIDRAERIDSFLAGNVHTVRPGGATRVHNPYRREVQK